MSAPKGFIEVHVFGRTRAYRIRVSSVTAYDVHPGGGSRVEVSGETYHVDETMEQLDALIAEAQS